MFVLPFHTLCCQLSRRYVLMAIVVLITGASTGLGYEVVRALCRSSRQHDIILAGMTVEMAAEAAKVIAAEFLASADGVWPIGINVEDDQSIQQAVKFVEDKFGKLDVLVHNAGRCCHVESPTFSDFMSTYIAPQAYNMTLISIPAKCRCERPGIKPGASTLWALKLQHMRLSHCCYNPLTHGCYSSLAAHQL